MKTEYGHGAAARKLLLLRRLAQGRLRTARQVRDLHEALCFLFAYPDNAAVFAQVRRMLAAFARRADLRRHRTALESSGIAGTDIVYSFYASTARWLAAHWGRTLTIEWDAEARESALMSRLPHQSLWAERPVFDEPPAPPRAWLDRLRGRDTDAAFVIRRSADLLPPGVVGDELYDELDLTLRLAPAPGSPSRTLARYERGPIIVQQTPLRTTRPDLRAAAEVPPVRASDVGARDAARLVHLAREAMVTRARDLYSFAAADPRDVRLVDCGDGLAFASMGVVPDQRLLLDAVYSMLMLRNGVPIGYALVATLWRSAEIAYNVFDTYRGAEAGWVYGRLLGSTRALFGADTFTVTPYQLGHENDEGLESGAWWFYSRGGDRPRDRATRRLAAREASRVRRRPAYRSSPATLRSLVRRNLFFSLGPPRRDVLGAVPVERIGLQVTGMVAARFGADRARAERVLADEAADRLNAGDWRRFPPGERLIWQRWAPLVAALPGLDGWSAVDRAALAEVIRAKGGRREVDYVARFDAHPRLGRALVDLARR